MGKTHLAITLGRKVILAGYSALLVTAPALLAVLARAHDEERQEEKLAHFAKPKLLIVDKRVYLPFEANAAHLFFQLISRRYEQGSLLISSNRTVDEWGMVFGDAIAATAILDRLLPPYDGLPCCSVNTSHCRVCSGLSPPSQSDRHPSGANSSSHGAPRHAWRTQKKGPVGRPGLNPPNMEDGGDDADNT